MGKDKETIEPIKVEKFVTPAEVAAEIPGVEPATADKPVTVDEYVDTSKAKITVKEIPEPQPFFTINKSKKKTEALTEEKPAKKQRTEPTNNILLGKIDEDVFNSIQPGKVVQARFFQQEVKVKYLVQPEDSPTDALTKLREAVFCAQYGRNLPANCELESTYGTSGLTARLGQAIAITGECDCYIEVYG